MNRRVHMQCIEPKERQKERFFSVLREIEASHTIDDLAKVYKVLSFILMWSKDKRQGNITLPCKDGRWGKIKTEQFHE